MTESTRQRTNKALAAMEKATTLEELDALEQRMVDLIRDCTDAEAAEIVDAILTATQRITNKDA